MTFGAPVHPRMLNNSGLVKQIPGVEEGGPRNMEPRVRDVCIQVQGKMTGREGV